MNRDGSTSISTNTHGSEIHEDERAGPIEQTTNTWLGFADPNAVIGRTRPGQPIDREGTTRRETTGTEVAHPSRLVALSDARSRDAPPEESSPRNGSLKVGIRPQKSEEPELPN